jgi:hypothetical protein
MRVKLNPRLLRADTIYELERFVQAAERHNIDMITFPTETIRELLELAKRAPRPGLSGKPPKGYLATRAERALLAEARKERAALVANGMPRKKATQQVAKEIAEQLGWKESYAVDMLNRKNS